MLTEEGPEHLPGAAHALRQAIFCGPVGPAHPQVSAEGILTNGGETQAAHCIAVDPSGDLVICARNTIGRISGNGSIERIAGGDVPGYAGDGGPALDAQFNAPVGLWVDDEAGAIYVVDQGNHRIRKLTPVVP